MSDEQTKRGAPLKGKKRRRDITITFDPEIKDAVREELRKRDDGLSLAELLNRLARYWLDHPNERPKLEQGSAGNRKTDSARSDGGG